MSNKPIEILADVIKWDESDEFGIYEYITVKEALEAMKIAMKQAYEAGYYFGFRYGYTDEALKFDEWLKKLEEEK